VQLAVLLPEPLDLVLEEVQPQQVRVSGRFALKYTLSTINPMVSGKTDSEEAS
jgi:hypothetical protein